MLEHFDLAIHYGAGDANFQRHIIVLPSIFSC
jgi:hypothetical protein